jgi:hypothetical protein
MAPKHHRHVGQLNIAQQQMNAAATQQNAE